MQVVILAGGYGTRLSEETDLIPKPMVRIGNIPILQHIMNFYSEFGHTDWAMSWDDKGNLVITFYAEPREGYFSEEEEDEDVSS